MKNQAITIRKVVKELNKKDGGFWLPNIQRNFVWKEQQIEKLFDSIMRDYPIGTLLVWKTKNKIKHRKFVDNYKNDTKFNDYDTDDKCKLLVLDGQQRLQSLFIGLCGSYNGKELYFNILSGDEAPPEEMKYTFKFKNKPSEEWIKLKDMVFCEKSGYSMHQDILSSLGHQATVEEQDKIWRNVADVIKVSTSDERIIYQEFDSVDNPKLYGDDDVVEIFIRANAGGTKLGKSDLLFSLLVSGWDEVEEKMENLLEDLNQESYAFTRDFVLKTCLVLLDKGAAYKVEKFRDTDIKNRIINEWESIANSIRVVRDYLYDTTYLRSKKAIKSYLALIPIIYFHYYNKDKWNSVKHLNNYIIRTLLAGAFGGSPDALIDNCIRTIKTKNRFDNEDIFYEIRNSGRSLEISKDDLLKQNYSKSNNLHLIFNRWYNSNLNYNPAYIGNELNIDHIFPTSRLKEIKLEKYPKKMRYNRGDMNQIANLMLLTREQNGAKGDTKPSDWFKNKDETYLDKHSIPKDPELWKIENFDKFIAERETLIVKKFRSWGIITKKTKE